MSLKPTPIYLILMSKADKITKCQMNVLDKGCAVLMLSVLLLFNKANPPVKEMSTHHEINYRFLKNDCLYWKEGLIFAAQFQDKSCFGKILIFRAVLISFTPVAKQQGPL